MHGSAVAQVTPDNDVEIFERLNASRPSLFGLGRAQRIEIAERLSRMFVAAVAGVDYRYGSVVSGHARRAFQRVADDDGISIIGDDADHVGDRFAFRG